MAHNASFHAAAVVVQSINRQRTLLRGISGGGGVGNGGGQGGGVPANSSVKIDTKGRKLDSSGAASDSCAPGGSLRAPRSRQR